MITDPNQEPTWRRNHQHLKLHVNCGFKCSLKISNHYSAYRHVHHHHHHHRLFSRGWALASCMETLGMDCTDTYWLQPFLTVFCYRVISSFSDTNLSPLIYCASYATIVFYYYHHHHVLVFTSCRTGKLTHLVQIWYLQFNITKVSQLFKFFCLFCVVSCVSCLLSNVICTLCCAVSVMGHLSFDTAW